MADPVYVSAAVEGLVDEAIVVRLIEYAGGVPGVVFGKSGKPDLRAKIAGYNHAAQRAPWIVLVDLNSEFNCAAALRQHWLPKSARGLCFRVAVRTAEAWLLADARTLARFLGVAASTVTDTPEALADPKREVVNLARRSRWRAVREDMVPRDGSGRAVGPAYTSRMIEFVQDRWRPDSASENCDSLRRAIACLNRLVAGQA